MIPERATVRPSGAVRKDYRRLAFASLVAVIMGLGYLVKLLPGRGIEASRQPTATDRTAFAGLREVSPELRAPHAEAPEMPKPDGQGDELKNALKQAESLNTAGKYDDAIKTMNRVRPLAGNSARAYLQLGRALQGKGDHATARDFFTKAIDLDPTLAEAYFDHATASESLGDLETALGGMRSFLHLVKNPDPYRLQVAQARSAIWEWEAKLGRGPWGPTKGIPPGFTADEIKRDGKGTAVKMPKPETLRPDGTMDYEIKAGNHFPDLWKK
jgi:tetratricopeptide (TPR) repeat protein